MKLIGAEGMSVQQLEQAVQDGAKLVVFEYCVSVIVMTFKRGSDVYLIQPGESAVVKGLPFSLISMLAGWWGVPWGPIYTVGAFITNFRGGKDVTSQVLQSLRPANPWEVAKQG